MCNRDNRGRDYVMTIHHDGRTETTLPIFIIPNPDDIQEAKETDGLINRFKVVIANILKKIQNTVSKDARAQVEANINTLLMTNSCFNCNLTEANLREADLTGANLIGADLTRATLQGVDLIAADLTFARLIEAVLGEAKLIDAKLIDAKLIGADLFDAKLIGADLRLADLSGTKLGDATWCDGECICAAGSVGECVGCGSVDSCMQN